jgi:hypothetical protein
MVMVRGNCVSWKGGQLSLVERGQAHLEARILQVVVAGEWYVGCDDMMGVHRPARHPGGSGGNIYAAYHDFRGLEADDSKAQYAEVVSAGLWR